MKTTVTVEKVSGDSLTCQVYAAMVGGVRVGTVWRIKARRGFGPWHASRPDRTELAGVFTSKEGAARAFAAA